jgi:hypothetical protein
VVGHLFVPREKIAKETSGGYFLSGHVCPKFNS